MNETSNNFTSPDPSDPLDQLLGEARWPEPNEAAQSRLIVRWSDACEFQRRRAHRVQWTLIVSTAATLLAAIVFGWSSLEPLGQFVARPEIRGRVPAALGEVRPGREPVLARQPEAMHMVKRPVAPQLSRTARADAAGPVSRSTETMTSRRPTPLEELLFAASAPRRKTKGRIRRESNGKSQNLATANVATKNAATKNPATHVAGSPNPMERQEIDRRAGDVSPRVLASSLDSVAIGTQLWHEADVVRRRALLAELLSRGDTVSLELYLRFVGRDETREEALAAAETVKNAPMDALFELLEDPLEARRLAAAHVIGRIDGPATTSRLIALIEQGTSRQEACVALLSSRGTEARAFVQSAFSDQTLRPLLQAAHQFIPETIQQRNST
jgi:hypothetical protein